MLTLRAPSICKPLTLLFENCPASREFPNVWKKSNIVPVNEKGDKQLKTTDWCLYFQFAEN